MKNLICAVLLALAAIWPAKAEPSDAVCSPRDGKNIRTGINVAAGGAWMSRWCLNSKNKYYLVLDVITAENAAMISNELHSLLDAPDYATALFTLQMKYPFLTFSPHHPTLKPVWIDSINEINGSRPADPEMWKVATNGTALTRQWWQFDPATSTLGAKSSGATVGMPCFPELGGTQLTVSGKVMQLMPFGVTKAKANPGRVTVCEKVEAV